MAKGQSPPPAPNPTQVAGAQSTANVDTAAAQAALSNVNQYTPYGSTTYDVTGSYTTPSGQTVPTYSQNTSLSPLGQSLLTGEQLVANSLLPTAGGLSEQAASSTATPLNFNTPFSSTLAQGPQLLDQNATNALYGQQKSFLDPQWNLQQQQLQDQLSRQGIPVGSDAYNSAMTQFNNSKTQAYQSAQDSAISQGAQAATQLFNMALSGQGQNISQQALAQQQPINLLQALLGASPQTGTQPITAPSAVPVAPTDVTGAYGLSTNAAMNAYQAQLAQQNAMFGGLASLGGAGMMAYGLGGF